MPEYYQRSSMNLVKFQDTKLMHRNLLHSYTLTRSEKEIKETIAFVIVQKNKIPRNKPIKRDKRPILWKLQHVDERNKRGHKLLGKVRRNNIFKMTILPKTIYGFNAISIILPMVFFTELEQIFFFLICMETQKTKRQSNIDIEKKNKRNKAPRLEIILQSCFYQTLWYWHKNRNTDQWNRTESPEINYAPMVSLSKTKEARIYNGKKKTGQLHIK